MYIQKSLLYFLSISCLMMVVILFAYAQDDFVLQWTTNTYTPDDYLGKKLPIANSQIFLEIWPTSNTINVSSYSYRWFINNRFYNLTTEPRTNFISANVKNYKIEVKIIDQNNIMIAEKIIFIPISQPETVLSYTQLVRDFFSLRSTDNQPIDRLDKQMANFEVWRPNLVYPSGNDRMIIYDNLVPDLAIGVTPYFFNIKSVNELSFSSNTGKDNTDRIQSQQNYQNIFLFAFNDITEPFQQIFRVAVQKKSNLQEKSEANLTLKFDLTN